MNKTKFLHITIILAIYSIGNGLMIFNNGWFWDDWVWITSEGLELLYKGTGLSYILPLMSYLFNISSSPALVFHFLTYVLEAFTIVMFYIILEKWGINSKIVLFFLTLFFSIAPYNYAKFSMVCFMYTFGFFLFGLGILFFHFFYKDKCFIFRFLSLIFIFLSFLFLPSLLPFSIFYFISFFLFNSSHIKLDVLSLKLLSKKIFSTLDFILLPFIFYGFRFFFLPQPSGIYLSSGYRSLSLESLLYLPSNFLSSFFVNFVGVFNFFPDSFSLFRLLLCISVFFLLSFIKFEKFVVSYKVILYGLLLFFAGVLAYLLIGVFPSFESYYSRHQILLKVGSVIILLFLVSNFSTVFLQKFAIFVLASSFLLSNVNTQMQFYSSWFKQLAFQKFVSTDEFLTASGNFMIIDNTKDYNEFKVDYALYVFTGNYFLVNGKSDKLLFSSRDHEFVSQFNPNLDSMSKAIYNISDVADFNYNHILVIDKGILELSSFQNIKLILFYYTNKNLFYNYMNKVLKFSIINVC
jgi:hypothetical protein